MPMPLELKRLHTILYVQDQDLSTQFYQKLLQKNANLYVPGMTEFQLHDFFTLGLMPRSGIAKLLDWAIEPRSESREEAQCELYLLVENVHSAFQHACDCGAKLLNPCLPRDWGDEVCYFADPDGHIIAFAQQRHESKGQPLS